MASVQIDPQISDFSKSMELAYGIDHNVVLAHWMSEEPIDSLSKWESVGNNPAGIKPGNSLVDNMSTGTGKDQLSPNGFLQFVTPVRGFQAYATLLMKDSHYQGVRDSIKTGDPQAELKALALSDWDAGHYGGDGHKLFDNYAAITGDSHVKTYTDQGAVMTPNPTTVKGQELNAAETAKANSHDLAYWLGLKDRSFWEIGVVVLGSIGILIILIMIVAKTKSAIE